MLQFVGRCGGSRNMAGVGAIVAIMILSASQPPVSSPEVRARMAKPSLSSAAGLGSKWGVVTSLKRSPERNRAVGGAPNSFHLFGRAIDIARRPGVRHADVEAAFRKAGFVLIESLDEGDHSHFAFGGAGSLPRINAPKSSQTAEKSPAKPETCRAEPANSATRRRPDRSDGCEALELPAI